MAHDPLPEGGFDLIHTRLVLIHVPERDEVVERLAAALRVRPTLLTGQVPLIRWLRERNKFTPDEFAAAIGVTVERLAALEAGATVAGPVELEAMARVLDVDPAALTRRVTDAA